MTLSFYKVFSVVEWVRMNMTEKNYPWRTRNCISLQMG